MKNIRQEKQNSSANKNELYGNSINLVNLSASKPNVDVSHSAQRKTDRSNMFSSMLDDVTFIADPHQPMRQVSQKENMLKENLRLGYQQTQNQ